MSDENAVSVPGEDEEPYVAEDWLSASETIRLVRTATLSREAHQAIALRASAGMLRAWAELLIVAGEHHSEVAVPKSFWWAGGHEALEQNWELGDFSTWVQRKWKLQAFGVRFHRGDLSRMLPQIAIPVGPATPSPKAGGGRKMSQHWPEWVAELVAHVHEKGIPDGHGNQASEELIEAIADRLAGRGLDAPARTTVQATMRAVLLRLRAGN